MLRFLSQVLAGILAALIVLFVIIPGIFIVLASSGVKPLPASMMLSLDMRSALPDREEVSLTGGDGPGVKSIVGLVRVLQRAETDERVKGVYLRVGGTGLSVAAAQELREALARFQARGKVVHAHTQSLTSPGLGAYYLASAADVFSMQPNGAIFTSGLQTSSVFLRGLLDEVGIAPDFRGRKQYKSAINTFMETDYTEPMREARTALITSVYDGVMQDISETRGVALDQLKAQFNDTPLIGDAAVTAGLVDSLSHEVDARSNARNAGGAGTQIVSVRRYASEPVVIPEGGTAVALVHAVGQIVEGDDAGGGLGDTQQIAGDVYARAIMSAVRNDEIKAIILRVDSPGGSPIASEQVRDALTRAQAAGKPVIVTMASLAASGGYWIAMTADKIVAHPGTLTGSIGVFTGKFAVGGLLNNIDVNMGEIFTNEGARLFSTNRTYTEEEWTRLGRFLDSIYSDFITTAAEGRSMSVAQVDDYAGGRIWSGADALSRGLIDSHGGLRRAMDLTREALNLSADAQIDLKDFPGRPGFFEIISRLFSGSVGVIEAAKAINEIMTTEAIVALRQAAILGSEETPLVYEEMGEVY